MRTLKFRVWDEKNKKMHKMSDGPAHSFKIYSDGSGGFGNYGGEPYVNFDSSTNPVMQMTGLKDKNGVEIYEGDVVQGRFVEEHVPDAMWLTLSDQERKQGFRLFTIRTIFEPYETPLPDDIEVIGNIYENGDLLK